MMAKIKNGLSIDELEQRKEEILEDFELSEFKSIENKDAKIEQIRKTAKKQKITGNK